VVSVVSVVSIETWDASPAPMEAIGIARSASVTMLAGRRLLTGNGT
jgi:hypothetical protein